MEGGRSLARRRLFVVIMVLFFWGYGGFDSCSCFVLTRLCGRYFLFRNMIFSQLALHVVEESL